MNFELGEELAMVQRSARDYAQRVLAPRAGARDRDETFPVEELQQLAKMGLLGMNVHSAYGGAEAGAVAGAWSMARVAMVAPRPSGDGWTVAGAALGGLLLGAVLLTMNLGHWYLVSRALPFQLLARGAALFAGFAAARAALLGAAIVVNPRPEGLDALLSLDRDALFFLFRVVWGLAGPLALSYFIWRTAEMKSNQAATGLLYVALVFVLIGELLSSYLTVATGFPA